MTYLSDPIWSNILDCHLVMSLSMLFHGTSQEKSDYNERTDRFGAVLGGPWMHN